MSLSGADPREIRDLLGSGPLGPGMRADRVLTWRLTRNSQPNSIRGGVCLTTTSSRRHPTPPGATQRRLTTPNATFGSQMARFARPYCATEPVRGPSEFRFNRRVELIEVQHDRLTRLAGVLVAYERVACDFREASMSQDPIPCWIVSISRAVTTRLVLPDRTGRPSPAFIGCTAPASDPTIAR